MSVLLIGSEYVDVEGAAEFLRLSVTYLNHLRATPLGPPWIRCGRRAIRYAIQDLRDWMTARRIGGWAVITSDNKCEIKMLDWVRNDRGRIDRYNYFNVHRAADRLKFNCKIDELGWPITTYSDIGKVDLLNDFALKHARFQIEDSFGFIPSLQLITVAFGELIGRGNR